jgi:hypothetical protein
MGGESEVDIEDKPRWTEQEMNISKDLQVRLETDSAVLDDCFVSGGLNAIRKNRMRGELTFGNRGQVRTCEPLQGLTIERIERPHHP